VRSLGVLALAGALALAGCGGGGNDKPTAKEKAPVIGQTGNEVPAQGPPLGYPVVASRNTTRVAGGDAIADAAGVALAAFPEAKPQAVVLADVNDWRTGLAASVLFSAPIKAPILFVSGDKVPDATAAALDRLAPTGAKAAGGAQVIRVGTKAPVTGFRTTDIPAGPPAAVAAAVDRLQAAAAGAPSDVVLIASYDRPEYAMPLAGWAAKAGDPILWVSRDAIPPETAAALKTHRKARLYVLGPAESVSDAVLDQLGKAGKVKRIAGADPVSTAIAFARYSDAGFGWNIVDPGHGLVFANARRPQDAAAAAALSGTGTYGPLLLLTDAGVLPQPLQDYLLDIQPGYTDDPVRGVYNHGWIIGDETAIAAGVQARIDTLLEIQPVDTGAN
jgi:Cell wall binding domain 2 (CWB2)